MDWLVDHRLRRCATLVSPHGGVGEFHPFGIAAYVAPAALMALTTGPLGEEAGWRGFFLPRLLGRYSPLVASVILGVIWGIWHVPLYVHSVFAQVDTGVSFVTSTVCFSIIMTCLFFHTRGSVLLAILFHWTVNISPQAANQMLPRHVAAVGAWGTMWNTGFVVVATLIVMAIAGPVALRRNGAFDAARDLAGEGVENDLAH